jgi:TatD DNase family protein
LEVIEIMKISAPFPVVDAHAHLDELDNVDEALETARTMGVAAVVGVGMDSVSNMRILDIARRYPGLVQPCVGLHPWNLNPETVERDLEFIAEHLPHSVALGEVGLDYKVKVKKRFQKDTFRRLLALASRLHKPVITHSRLSHKSTFDMVVEAGIEKAVFHWYSGPIDVLDRIAGRGYFISATPALAYSKLHRECVARIPLDNLLLETDCPVAYQDTVSRPEHVLQTLDLVSEIKGLSKSGIARETTRNAEHFFGFSLA